MRMTLRLALNRWDEQVRSVEVQIELDGNTRAIASVQQSISLRDMKPERASVNWYAKGSVTPDIAAMAGCAIIEAARIANEMEAVKEWDRITPPVEGTRWTGSEMPTIHILDGKAWVDPEGWAIPDDTKSA
jgi:hypothetical protein